jgi:hypothetical protein
MDATIVCFALRVSDFSDCDKMHEYRSPNVGYLVLFIPRNVYFMRQVQPYIDIHVYILARVYLRH